MIVVKKDVEFAQGYGCAAMMHVGSTAVFVWPRNGWPWVRLDLFTPKDRFRLSSPSRFDAQRRAARTR